MEPPEPTGSMPWLAAAVAVGMSSPNWGDAVMRKVAAAAPKILKREGKPILSGEAEVWRAYALAL